MPWYFMDTAVWLGCLGGALPDALRLIQGRHGEVPTYLGSLYFWVSLVLLVALGGATAAFTTYTLGATQNMTQAAAMINALAVGYSAPSVLSKLLSEPAIRITDRAIPKTRSLRGWWAA
jgi:hypothetical protein